MSSFSRSQILYSQQHKNNLTRLFCFQAVKLESVHPGRTRYLVVVSCTGRQDAEESCLLGIDCHARATVGLVLRVLADTAITLDGDGYVGLFSIFSHHFDRSLYLLLIYLSVIRFLYRAIIAAHLCDPAFIVHWISWEIHAALCTSASSPHCFSSKGLRSYSLLDRSINKPLILLLKYLL